MKHSINQPTELFQNHAIHFESEDPDFSDEDHETWSIFFREIETMFQRFPTLVHPFYRENFGSLKAFRTRIPTLQQINQILKPIGWKAKYVNGYEPSWEIARLLAAHTLPISRSIRQRSQVFFANEPDLIHDIFGHIPSLLNREYRRILALWAKAASNETVSQVDLAHYHLNKLIAQSQDNVPKASIDQLTSAAKLVDNFIKSRPTATQIYDKAYFWIFEFGVVEHLGQRAVLGAGLLSSLTEFAHFATCATETIPFSIDTILAPTNISSSQNAYLVVDSAAQYRKVLNTLAESTVMPEINSAGRHAIH